MGAAGVSPAAVHLHFEVHDIGPPYLVLNPLHFVPMKDLRTPDIDQVYIRRAPPDGSRANVQNQPSTGISGLADLVIRGRDRAHPSRNSFADNGFYSVWVDEPRGVGNWPTISFDVINPAIDRQSQQHNPRCSLTTPLSNREIEVLKWLFQGKSNWDMGAILNISENTVKNHVQNIIKKLNANNRQHAVAKALEMRVIQL